MQKDPQEEEEEERKRQEQENKKASVINLKDRLTKLKQGGSVQ